MRLYQTNKYEIAELACYGQEGTPYVDSVPWKVYPVVPKEGTLAFEQYVNISKNAKSIEFGATIFDEVALDFEPDFVCNIKDYWMMVHEHNSPYRKCFKWIIMPTVDSAPQQDQWVDVYCDADAVFTYQDWSGQVLTKQSGGKVKYKGSASPAASSIFKPRTLPERKQLKSSLRLGPDIKVIGTVMRNQRRKLYPNLFSAFRKFLNKTKRKDIVLYCHVSYPDNSWDIPQLLKEFNLSSQVFLTYICNVCGYIHPSTFQDAGCVCPNCHQYSCGIASAQRGINDAALNDLYNMFDMYVQYSNSEGFGMPQVEAAMAGVPVAATNYSAMEDIMKKINGYAVNLLTLDKEIETGCNRAIPDDNHMVEIWEQFFNMPEAMRERKRQETRKLAEETYNWDWTANKWMDVFNNMDGGDWRRNPIIHGSAPYEQHSHLSNYEYAEWLITDVLGEPDKLHSYFHMRLVRDLNYGVAMEGLPGMYYNDMANLFSKIPHTPFNREIAYKKVEEICHRRNLWESLRSQKLGLG